MILTLYKYFLHKKIEKITAQEIAASKKFKDLFSEINDYFDLNAKYLQQQSAKIKEARELAAAGKNDDESRKKIALALQTAQSPFATNQSEVIDKKTDELDKIADLLRELQIKKISLYKKLGIAYVQKN